MITLREVVQADIDAFYEFQSDPAARAMVAFGPPDREAHAAYWRSLSSDTDAVSQAVEVDGALGGSVICYQREGRRYVAYSVRRDFWGRGLATEALRLFVGELTERPLYAWVVLSNVGSRRVLEKTGFRPVDPQPPPNQTDVPERLFVVP